MGLRSFFAHVFLSLLYMIMSVLCLHNCTMHISTGLLHIALEAKQGVACCYSKADYCPISSKVELCILVMKQRNLSIVFMEDQGGSHYSLCEGGGRKTGIGS